VTAKKDMKKFVSILISLVILFLIAVAVYKSYTPNSEVQKTAAVSAETSADSVPLMETAPATAANETAGDSTTTAANETVSSSTTETALVTTETTAETTDINFPTLKLIVYEGPVMVQDSDMVYYRVEARVTGNPAPFIKFSRDDSAGVWGKNIAQINLKNGESYDLVATAVNSFGSVRKHIVLTWSQ
jgi:hypothetical protein